MTNVFISYSRADKERVERIVAYIDSVVGEVWWDDRLVAGESFTDEVEHRLNEADFVVVGKVTKVFHRDFSSEDQYVVQIRIEEVEKGEGYREKEYIFAYAFQRKSGLPPEPSASGHSNIPEEGQRIRARIMSRKGEMEALYPEWFEVLPTTEREN